jgi:release factor glutamine methyltransferase
MIKTSEAHVTLQDAWRDMRARFSDAGIDTPTLDARLLVQSALGLTHEELLMRPHQPLTPEQEKTLASFEARRLKREPVSRILGQRAFWKSFFKVTPATLDPRPDSETLVEAVLRHAERDRPLAVLDLGTGTGCLLLSLLQELPQATGTGIDISPEAVEVARQNAEALDLNAKSIFMANSWNELTPSALFDIVISNPPYISDAEMAALAPEVREYDPVAALSGGADGLDCYREIAALLPRLLGPQGAVFLEIGATQAEAVKGILAHAGLRVLQTCTDLAGHDRCIVARWMKA